MSGRALMLWALLLAATPVAGAGCETVGFSGVAELYGGEATPWTLAFVNLNRDAWPDLIIAGSQPNDRIGSILVIPGNGQTWNASQEIALPHRVTDIAAGDFDGDGDDDLVYTSFRDVHILMNEGGTLRQTGLLANVGSEDFLYVVSGDFNGDRRDDFAAFFIGAQLFLSRGDGTFEQETLLAAGTVGGHAAGDLDRDGRDELILGRAESATTGQLLIFRGEPDGLGAPRVIPTTQPYPTSIGIGDIDGDGAKDIAFFTPNVWLDVIRRAANPESQVERITVQTPPGSFAPSAVADFNGDGIDDLAERDFTFGLSVLFGSRGTMQLPAAGHWVPDTDLGGSIAVADVDLDGDIDVAAVTEDGFSILKNDGKGAFDSPPFATEAVAVGDFNDDGRDDLIDEYGLRLADSRGQFTAISEAEYYVNKSYRLAHAADMNGDGHLDVVLYGNRNLATRGLVVRFGDGRGGLGPAGPLYRTGTNKDDLTVADVDGDGDLDAILTGSQETAIALSDGKGGFVASPHGAVFSGAVATGDLDGDGDIDLAVNDGWLAMNDGKGAFTLTPFQQWERVQVADMNRDGRLDLITTVGSTVRVYLGRAGGFIKTADFTVDAAGVNVTALHVRDFNRDGIPDVLVTEGGSSADEGWMALMLGDGTGRLLLQPKLRSTARETRIGDFNGDDATDVLDAGFPRINTCAAPKRRAARH